MTIQEDVLDDLWLEVQENEEAAGLTCEKCGLGRHFRCENKALCGCASCNRRRERREGNKVERPVAVLREKRIETEIATDPHKRAKARTRAANEAYWDESRKAAARRPGRPSATNDYAPLTDEACEDAVRLLGEGKPLAQVARQLNVERSNLHRGLKRRGLPVRPTKGA